MKNWPNQQKLNLLCHSELKILPLIPQNDIQREESLVKMEKNVKQRKCVGCGELKDASQMIKLTKNYLTQDIIVNPNSKIFGRSAYLCYNNECIKLALKKNRLNKVLKTNKDLKGLLNGQY